MPFKSRQLLLRAAKLGQEEEEKVSKKEIEKRINQIKYLTSDKKFPKIVIRKEILKLEKLLRSVLVFKDKIQEQEKKKTKEIAELKQQIKELRKKILASQDPSLKKKVEKLSHILGELMAKDDITKEVRFEKARIIKVPETVVLTIRKIDNLREKILTLRDSGTVPPEKIAQLKKRLTNLEKKLPIHARHIRPETDVKHKMLFGPKVIKVDPDLPLPPPPEKKEKD
ncbi:hypothetical protein GOV03_00025 [Candidatus Woesearchaeota archaeon]|nr:hypothetical protein [Candidatus Woesearchaeota archaeon]